MRQQLLVIFTIQTENLPSNFQEIIQLEQEVVGGWKSEGIIEHLYLRPARNGAILVLNELDESKAEKLMSTLPLFPWMQSIEYFPIINPE